MESSLVFRSVSGTAIAPHVEDLAQLRIAVFRDFPYLYVGDEAYERSYLQTYLDAPRSVAMLVFDGERLVGASTGLPMVDETEEFQRPFVGSGMDVEGVFYCAESVLLPAWRGRGVYRHMFEAREAHARALGGFHTTAFCCVQRDPGHPARPAGYEPLDAVWRRFGYVEHPELQTEFSWKDVGEDAESPKPMRFWLKDLS